MNEVNGGSVGRSWLSKHYSRSPASLFRRLGTWLSSTLRTSYHRLSVYSLLMVFFITTGCSGLGGKVAKTAAGAVLGTPSGPSIDAQVGQTNTRQNVGVQAGRDVVNTRETVSSGSTEQIIVNEVSDIVLFLLVLTIITGTIGWILPSPAELWKKWTNRNAKETTVQEERKE